MGFEDGFLNKIDRNIKEHDREARIERRDRIGKAIEHLVPSEYPEAHSYLTSQAIQIEQFSDLYGENVIAEDIHETNRLKRIFEANDSTHLFPNGMNGEQVRQLSEITEAYLLRGINENDWIPHCKCIKTADYDDYKNGTDMVLEYKRADTPASHIGLGVDVTFSANLEKKLGRIRREIDDGILATIKYFDSPNSHIRGQLKAVPRAIVGFDIDSISRLAEYRRTKNELPKHDPLRFVTLHQLSMQMRTYDAYATKVDSPVAPMINRTSKFLDLLSTYAKQNNPYYTKFIQENAQVKRFARALESFEQLG